MRLRVPHIFVFVGIFCLIASGKKSSDDKSSATRKNSDDIDNDAAELIITVLNEEPEHDELPDETENDHHLPSREPIEDQIDRMPHLKDTTRKPAPLAAGSLTQGSFYLQEYVPERQIKPLSPIAQRYVDMAYEVLYRRRHLGGVTSMDLRAAYLHLEEAADLGSLEAKKLLGFAKLYGDYSWDPYGAKRYFAELVEAGSTDGHLGMALIQLTGITLKRPNRALGMLHLQFAANAGSPLAMIAIGYRYSSGIDSKPNCEKALSWYKIVAKMVASKVTFLGGPAFQRIRIPDEVDSPSNIIMDNNAFTYYTSLAENGDISAMLILGQLRITGSKGVEINYEEAAKYFGIAADSGNVQAYAYLAKMYYDGTPATPQNDDMALRYFKRAADKGNSMGQTGLGLMNLMGRGVKRDYTRAFRLFAAATDQGSIEGQFYFGYMYYMGFGVRRDYKKAYQLFHLASQSGNLLALYNLAAMSANGIGISRSCSMATELYKNVAERGRWTDRFMASYFKYQYGSIDEAAFDYMLLGELGYEVAQSNFAHLMEERVDEQQLFTTKAEAYKWALLSWQRAANQQYSYARVKLGDFNYYGRGTKVDYLAAVNHYKMAVDLHQSPQAMFNLGYMHERGLGFERDLHMAKRYYDLAAETAQEAYVPVVLALIKLHIILFTDYLNEKMIWQKTLFAFLDSNLGPHWDFFVMSFITAIVPYLIYQFIQNRFQPAPPPATTATATQRSAAHQPARAVPPTTVGQGGGSAGSAGNGSSQQPRPVPVPSNDPGPSSSSAFAPTPNLSASSGNGDSGPVGSASEAPPEAPSAEASEASPPATNGLIDGNPDQPSPSSSGSNPPEQG